MVRVLLAVCALLPIAAYAQQAKPANLSKARRVALVIGNSKYEKLPKLASVEKDVGVISAALGNAKFEIHKYNDFTMPGILSIRQDAAKFVKPGDVCFVYYAGYAMQGPDDNYLLPTNFDPQGSANLEDRALHFTILQETLGGLNAGLQIYLLEGPPEITVPVNVLQTPGLSNPALTKGKETFYISAGYTDSWAPPPGADGVDLLTKAAAKAIDETTEELDQVFVNIRRDANASGHRLYSESNMVSQFYFREPPPPPPPPKPTWPRSGIPVQNSNDREEYLWIPKGKFMMGCVPGDDRCKPEEKPRHEVTLPKGFWMGVNEVTVDSYQKYVAANKKSGAKMPPAPHDKDGWRVTNEPIVNVSWDEARRYCVWAGGRLPTEAEWEYAARGGVDGEIFPYKDENSSRENANFAGTSLLDIYDYRAPVRKFKPNSFGLYDMSGNVWEWVNDRFSAKAYTANPISDPQGPDQGNQHVRRGGSYDSDPKEHLRISFRQGYGEGWPNLGFRCAIDDTPQSRKQLPEPGALR